MPTNPHIVRLSNRLEAIKTEVQTRLDRATPEGEDHPTVEYFKTMNPDIEMSLGKYVETRTEEYDAVQQELDDYRKADTSLASLEKMAGEGQKRATWAPNPTGSMGRNLSGMVTESDSWKNFIKGDRKGAKFDVDLDLKALFETTTTGAVNSVSVESVRTGELVPAALTRVTLLDIIPQVPTTDPVVKYDEEVLNESAVAAIAQGAVYEESAFQYDEKSVNVAKIGAFINVSEEALDDEPELQARLDGSLRNQMMRRIQSDIIGGVPIPASEYVGTPTDNTNFTGFTELTGVNVIDAVAQPGQMTGDVANHFSLLEQAREVVYRLGMTEADAIVMNSQDWLQLKTLQTTTGAFVIRGALSALYDPAAMQIDGLPVVLCNALPNNTVLVGAFREHAVIRDRQSVQVRIQEAQNVTIPSGGGSAQTEPSGRFNIYTDARLAFYVRRPSAFARITSFGEPQP